MLGQKLLKRLLVLLTIVFFTCISLPLAATAALSPCPASPNCVLSQGADSTHNIEPFTYQGDRAAAYTGLLKVLTVVPRTTVVEQSDGYIKAESTSRIFKFVDDLEFYFPEGEKLIQIRSAARVGDSDLGVNRRRLEQIRLALKDLGI